MQPVLRPPADAIILTGFMGTGKSVVAKLLSRRWGLRSIDTDAMLEKQVGASIAEIFATRGEQHFRDLETQVLTQLAGQHGLIVSTGGGILLREDNVELLRQMGPVICLHASAETIMQRTAASSERPLLNRPDPQTDIQQLLAERDAAYQQADYHVATDELSVEQAAEAVAEAMRADPRGCLLAPEPVEIPVELGDDSYTIHIGNGLLEAVGEIAAPDQAGHRAAVITDDNLEELYASAVAESLERAGWDVALFVVPSGEGSKTLASAGQLCEQLAEAGLDRSGVVFAVGGGMVGDLAGFVAAVYMRGIPFIQVPTTLLAQVDASVGGKVAVDLPRAKNLVGAFHQPQAVIVDIETLSTLSGGQFQSGLAEVIKHAAIADAEMFSYLAENLEQVIGRDPASLKYLLARNCQIKAEVVTADPHEQGQRAVLNFGHTIGHALERAAPQWQLSHGEAVAVGMVAESEVAVKKALSEPDVPERLRRLVTQAGLQPDLTGIDPQQAGTAMSADKKLRGGRLRLPVVPRIGQVILTDQIQLADLQEAIERLLG
ncbi:MAG: 3-dehydroquinate synthase [Armatimonadetes bacterium]|nr:3-dehydroquinate synthase [Armatimonadota bacterium]